MGIEQAWPHHAQSRPSPSSLLFSFPRESHPCPTLFVSGKYTVHCRARNSPKGESEQETRGKSSQDQCSPDTLQNNSRTRCIRWAPQRRLPQDFPDAVILPTQDPEGKLKKKKKDIPKARQKTRKETGRVAAYIKPKTNMRGVSIFMQPWKDIRQAESSTARGLLPYLPPSPTKNRRPRPGPSRPREP